MLFPLEEKENKKRSQNTFNETDAEFEQYLESIREFTLIDGREEEVALANERDKAKSALEQAVLTTTKGMRLMLDALKGANKHEKDETQRREYYDEIYFFPVFRLAKGEHGQIAEKKCRNIMIQLERM